MKLSPLFQVASSEPAKLRRGYTNFAVVDPPLKLVLIEDPTKIPVWLNHLGVVVASSEEVAGPAGEGTRPRHRGGRRRLPDLFVATAIYSNTTLDAMSDLDLCYSPPLGSPWDAVQMAGRPSLDQRRTSSTLYNGRLLAPEAGPAGLAGPSPWVSTERRPP